MSRGAPGRDRTAAAVALLAVAATWGATYVVVKDAVATMPVGDFLVWRFGLAALVVLALRPGTVPRLRGPDVAGGTLAGLALATGYLLQTTGLRTTPATVSGFITGLLVVVAPLASALLFGERTTYAGWAAVGLATVGLGLLSLRGMTLGPGEVLTLGCAVALGLHLVALSRWATPHNVVRLAVVQLCTLAVVSMVVAVPGGLGAPPTPAAWRAVVVTGVLATSAAYFVQTWAQARLSATSTGVILTTEPVFAGVVGVALAGERFGARAAVGAVLVLAAMLLTVLRPAPRPGPRHRRSRLDTGTVRIARQPGVHRPGDGAVRGRSR